MVADAAAAAVATTQVAVVVCPVGKIATVERRKPIAVRAAGQSQRQQPDEYDLKAHFDE
jgi:hypothetical protein